MQAPVTPAEQRQLLDWSRRAIAAAVARAPAWRTAEAELTANLRLPHAAFVTLWKQGELRGCIGRMDFARPLWQNVLQAATAAALEDPRFSPVSLAELPALALEISILNPPVPIPSWQDFDVTRHGIIVERGLHGALLLPKVARDHGWSAAQTLEAVCHKAGLPADAWRLAETRLQVFEAHEFAD